MRRWPGMPCSWVNLGEIQVTIQLSGSDGLCLIALTFAVRGGPFPYGLETEFTRLKSGV